MFIYINRHTELRLKVGLRKQYEIEVRVGERVENKEIKSLRSLL